MAKFLCVFALAGMAAGSPVAYRVSSADQEVVVNRIMVGLQPAIDDAIAKALSGLYSSSGSVSYGTGSGFGSSVNQGFSTSNQGFSASNQGFSTANQGFSSANQGFSASNQGFSSQGVTKGTTHFQSAGANGVVYHDGASAAVGQQQQQQQAINSAQYGTTTQQTISSSANQQKIVQGVMAALVPQIEAAVQAAMRNQQSSSVSSTSFNTGVTTSTVSQVNAQEEQALVTRIIQVLTPTITTSVRKALAARVQVQTVPVTTTVTQQSSFNQNAGLDTSALIAQIISVLKPSIAVSVEEALASRQSFNTQQAVQTSSNVGFASQASQGFNSAAVSGGSLSSIFGDGSAHNVKVQTPEYSIEYNN